jgi:hypothetical protein
MNPGSSQRGSNPNTRIDHYIINFSFNPESYKSKNKNAVLRIFLFLSSSGSSGKSYQKKPIDAKYDYSCMH